MILTFPDIRAATRGQKGVNPGVVLETVDIQLRTPIEGSQQELLTP